MDFRLGQSNWKSNNLADGGSKIILLFCLQSKMTTGMGQMEFQLYFPDLQVLTMWRTYWNILIQVRLVKRICFCEILLGKIFIHILNLTLKLTQLNQCCIAVFSWQIKGGGRKHKFFQATYKPIHQKSRKRLYNLNF